MVYSKTCEYAVRALIYLCQRGEGVYAGASEISKETGVPAAYITKIFQSLTREGILKSRRGIGGGVAICCSVEELTLMQIVDAIEDLGPFHECAMGLKMCEDHNPCPVHDVWKRAKEEIICKFKETKLTELVKQSDKFQYGEAIRYRLKTAIA